MLSYPGYRLKCVFKKLIMFEPNLVAQLIHIWKIIVEISGDNKLWVQEETVDILNFVFDTLPPFLVVLIVVRYYYKESLVRSLT